MIGFISLEVKVLSAALKTEGIEAEPGTLRLAKIPG